MWKAFSRYIREPLERKLVSQKREKLDNVSSTPTRYKCRCLRKISLVPVIIQDIKNSFHLGHLSSFDKGKYTEPSDENETWKESAQGIEKPSWIEAAGWSGALAVGWVLSQNIYLNRRRINNTFNSFRDNFNFSLKNLFVRHVFTQPLNNTTELPSDNLPYSRYKGILPAFGPQTADETLNEAAYDFSNAHNKAIAEMESRLGLQYMSKKKYRKAVTHFAAASALQNSSAAYYLAQCYELGLGIKQDFKKAAQYYQTASNLGHATAMYNLGVFYAHGWGGLKSDVIEARKLIEKAANLGQSDAKAIVSLQNKPPPPITCFPNGECMLVDDPSYTTNQNNDYDLSLNADDIPYVVNELKNSSFKVVNFISKVESGAAGENISLDDCSNDSCLGRSSSRSSLLSPDIEASLSDVDCSQESADYYSGICYENGFGVKRNKSKAMELYTKGAYNGDANALFNLAACYESIPLNGNQYQSSLTVELYKMAAKQGHHQASEKCKTLEIYQVLGILPDVLNSNTSSAGKMCHNTLRLM